MTHSLCQRGCSADRTIRLFSGGDGRAREIDANRLDRRERTRESCRRGRSIRPRVLRNATTINARRRCRLPKAALAGEPAAAARRPPAGPAAPRPIAPQIVLHVRGNTRRFCVLSGAERCANDFLP
ncbi:hypothetical protein [Burkholderia lata]|uniref:hypothetical protein n=1 Tax=Burkholderia lata (strain ATCC 17760 / DSM 23089 / LMG 22485 / NCIMB 9086 / R18194 / 383) TaxID=482957 RepID=UPI0015843D7D|nr:hypothetical protein [Burkholderia lata]